MTRTAAQGYTPVRIIPALVVALGTMLAIPVAESVTLRPGAPIYVDGSGIRLAEPNAVGCGEGSLVVADTGNSRLLRYEVTTDAITAQDAIVLPQLPYPIGVVVNSKGELYVLDGRLRRILHLAATGEFESYVEPAGRDEFVPRSLAIDAKDNLYVLDILSGAVVVIDPEGQVIREVAFPEEYGFFSDIAVDRIGRLFALDSVGKRLFKAARDDAVLAPFTPGLHEDLDFPVAVTADKSGRLLVADQHGGGIVFLGPDGSFQGRQLRAGRKPGWLRHPSDLCIIDDVLFVADRANNRVQVLLMAD
jgi:DNA-binding beta-propeller fold protein YncE